MKTLLFLTFAAVSMHAAQVEYLLTDGARDIMSFVTNGFLPNVQDPDPYRGTPTWTIPESQLVADPCPTHQPPGSSCRIQIQQFNGYGYPYPQVGIAAIFKRSNGEEENLLAGFGPFLLDDLEHY